MPFYSLSHRELCVVKEKTDNVISRDLSAGRRSPVWPPWRPLFSRLAPPATCHGPEEITKYPKIFKRFVDATIQNGKSLAHKLERQKILQSFKNTKIQINRVLVRYTVVN